MIKFDGAKMHMPVRSIGGESGGGAGRAWEGLNLRIFLYNNTST